LDESGNPYGDNNSLVAEHLKEGLEFMEEFEKSHLEAKK
jgi:hypothetical protein